MQREAGVPRDARFVYVAFPRSIETNDPQYSKTREKSMARRARRPRDPQLTLRRGYSITPDA
jgi:hypothetical protein